MQARSKRSEVMQAKRTEARCKQRAREVGCKQGVSKGGEVMQARCKQSKRRREVKMSRIRCGHNIL
jgi:hypothetical protein